MAHITVTLELEVTDEHAFREAATKRAFEGGDALFDGSARSLHDCAVMFFEPAMFEGCRIEEATAVANFGA